MSSEYQRYKDKSLRNRDIHKPEFFRLNIDEDKRRFDDLLASDNIILCDEIYDQLKELIKSRHPAVVLTAEDYTALISQHLNGVSFDNYGVWVYYPWSSRIVHILDESEYIELRTAANKNKITIAEREILATKKVGVIGLSVGQSVSLTLAMERGCSELRLADFDTLELNNLNRIRTGVHNLGLLKAYSVAREIAEIDPYFKVVCYTEGITEDNIDDFFTKGGKLDAVIDECDGINIKILCRIKAKEFSVPVLMEASDRGTLDVERFDLDPGRPIMHGWLEHLTLDFNVLKNLKSNEEKVPYMLPISGLDTLSSRMKASMIELRNTITTWPQLATAVTLGGALTADTCRRIFLNQFTDSGRYFIDLEMLIPDTREKTPFIPEPAQAPLTSDDLKDISGKALSTLAPAVNSPGAKDIERLVSTAVKAPSAGNSQPWKWFYNKGYLFLFYENTSIVSFGDFEQIASHIAHGAALENLALEAKRMGLNTGIHLFPIAGERKLVAAIGFDETVEPADLFHADELVNCIDARATNRKAGDGNKIRDDVLAQLTEAVASVPGAELIIKSNANEIADLANIIGPAERLKFLNPASHYEFFEKELRWTEEESKTSGDGISLAALNISQPEEIALKMIRYPEVTRLLAEWKGGQALEYTSRRAVQTAAAIGLIVIPEQKQDKYVLGGRAMQRMWLTATQNNICVQPMMTPILHFARHKFANGTGVPAFMHNELELLNEKFHKLFSNIEGKSKIFLFRLFVAEKPAVSTFRRPSGAILSFA